MYVEILYFKTDFRGPKCAKMNLYNSPGIFQYVFLRIKLDNSEQNPAMSSKTFVEFAYFNILIRLITRLISRGLTRSTYEIPNLANYLEGIILLEPLPSSSLYNLKFSNRHHHGIGLYRSDDTRTRISDLFQPVLAYSSRMVHFVKNFMKNNFCSEHFSFGLYVEKIDLRTRNLK